MNRMDADGKNAASPPLTSLPSISPHAPHQIDALNHKSKSHPSKSIRVHPVYLRLKIQQDREKRPTSHFHSEHQCWPKTDLAAGQEKSEMDDMPFTRRGGPKSRGAKPFTRPFRPCGAIRPCMESQHRALRHDSSAPHRLRRIGVRRSLNPPSPSPIRKSSAGRGGFVNMWALRRCPTTPTAPNPRSIPRGISCAC